MVHSESRGCSLSLLRPRSGGQKSEEAGSGAQEEEWGLQTSAEADLGSVLQDPCRPWGRDKRAQGHLCQGPT